MKPFTTCAAVLVAGAAMAQEIPPNYDEPTCGAPGSPPCEWEEPKNEDRATQAKAGSAASPSATPTCKTDLGYGLVSYTVDQAMFDEINRRLEAGETVVSTNGFTILGTAIQTSILGDQRLVICFRY